MRLFLLPVSTRRSLIYCEKLHDKAPADRSYYDKLTIKANETWAAWEKDEKAPLNWKKKVTFYGNQALSKIPYEEWGLKTIPALNAKRKQDIVEGRAKYDVLFPGLYLHQNRLPEILKKLATERQAMHRSKLIWSVVIMPFTAPFMLVPVIPNLPFFYVLYRAWSHWKALSGSKHLEFLLQHHLPTPAPSPMLDEVYTAGLMYPTRQISRAAPRPTLAQAEQVASVVEQQTNDGNKDVMVLQRWNGKLIAEQFQLPDMEVEIERAVEQVEKSIKAKEELIEEKLELEMATAKEGGRAVDALPEELLHPIAEADKKIHEEAEKVASGQSRGDGKAKQNTGDAKK
ncbi:mitochondrial K+-H+ exchange-related-domain-containing protein [Massariosphaeria phaeospora]|uniref:Mitochondrial K+-H+ exchange-related-domain-containing protein n=1 Tax=Massariosphaeria phaeospora TaxID=100035 RepID=A0A7C8I820_9PLEO|nr:mitochondrial K+-H+ exchange-related-domain-containing protein [Massariosphaeria phaeospora]